MEEGERKGGKSDSEETAACSSSSAVPVREPGADGKAVADDTGKLDVCSEKFDPLSALYSPAVSLPFPNVKCFNNVAAYESFLRGGRGRAKPENVEKRRLKAMKGVADPERIERLKKLMVNQPLPESEEGEGGGGAGGGAAAAARGRRRQKPQKNVLTRMPLCKGSPLGELHRCVEERIRVKVHIRTFKGLRGVCSGFVVAFDKFWNMAMVDVDETYREPLLGEAFHHEKALTISRLFEKLKLQESCGGGDDAAMEREARERAGERPPANPEAHRKGQSSRPPGGRGEGTPPDTVATKHKVSAKARGPSACQKGDSRTYGKIHMRHINQLFIRGESIILVNPQPL